LVPYKSGTEEVNAIVAGQVPAIFVSLPLQQYVDQGKLYALATTSAKRTKGMANWPTIAESGLQNYSGINNWVGLFAPIGTPQAIIVKLNESFNKVFQNPEVQKKAASGGDLVGGTPEQQADRIRKELEVAGPTIRKLGLKYD